MDNRLKGAVSLCFASFLWGMWGVFSRFLGLSFGVFYQSFNRSLILLVIISVFILLKKSWKRVEKKDWKWFFIISAGGLVSGIGSFIGFNHLAISTTLFYYYVGCVIGGYLLGKLFFSEKLTKIKITALILCLIGLLMVFYSAIKKGEIVFILLALAAGFGGSVWGIFSKKITTKYSLTQPFLSIILFLPSVVLS